MGLSGAFVLGFLVKRGCSPLSVCSVILEFARHHRASVLRVLVSHYRALTQYTSCVCLAYSVCFRAGAHLVGVL